MEEEIIIDIKKIETEIKNLKRSALMKDKAKAVDMENDLERLKDFMKKYPECFEDPQPIT